MATRIQIHRLASGPSTGSLTDSSKITPKPRYFHPLGFLFDLNISMENPQPLSLTDLAVIKKTIEVACKRGAFEAAEMQAVGSVYDRLSNFLNSLVAEAEAQAQSNPKGESQ